jgi:hypothetical protein
MDKLFQYSNTRISRIDLKFKRYLQGKIGGETLIEFKEVREP